MREDMDDTDGVDTVELYSLQFETPGDMLVDYLTTTLGAATTWNDMGSTTIIEFEYLFELMDVMRILATQKIEFSFAVVTKVLDGRVIDG